MCSGVLRPKHSSRYHLVYKPDDLIRIPPICVPPSLEDIVAVASTSHQLGTTEEEWGAIAAIDDYIWIVLALTIYDPMYHQGLTFECGDHVLSCEFILTRVCVDAAGLE